MNNKQALLDLKKFANEETSEVKFAIISKLVKLTYNDSFLRAETDYLEIEDIHYEITKNIFAEKTEVTDGFKAAVENIYFEDSVWNEDNLGYIEINKQLDEKTSLHFLVATNLEVNFIERITNPNIENSLEVGDTISLDGAWYKIKKIEKSDLVIDKVQYYDIFLDFLFLKTLEKRNKDLTLYTEAKTRIIIPGEVYKHFKGNYYKVLCLAKDTETNEDKVIYQALYGDKQIYVRGLDMFRSPVDSKKYPKIKQSFRFEQQESKFEV